MHRGHVNNRRGGRGATRLVQLALLGILLALVLVVTAAAAPPACTQGASSVGPAVLIDGHLVRQRSDLTPHTVPCLRGPDAVSR